MQSSNLYLIEHNDNFPFVAKTAGGTIGICSWFYGGKTNDDYWRGQLYFYHEVDRRPMNKWILGQKPEPDLRDAGGNIIKRTEVPSLQCPSDGHSFQRDWGTAGAEGDFISCYDDIGTSYHYNLAVFLYPGPDVVKNGMTLGQTVSWVWYQGGWAIMNRDLIRNVLLRHPADFVMFHEDPMDWGLGQYPTKIRTMGNHRKFSKHSTGFLDGHAKCDVMDTRLFCGTGWASLNPEWINYPDQAKKAYYYASYTFRNCDPLK